MANWKPVLIIAQPSPLRDSLTTLLMTMPRISSVDHAGDATTAMRLMASSHPAIVVLDASLPGGEAWALLRRIKTAWPDTVCIVLTDALHLGHRAKAAGANQALMKGFPAAKLSLMLEQLLQQAA